MVLSTWFVPPNRFVGWDEREGVFPPPPKLNPFETGLAPPETIGLAGVLLAGFPKSEELEVVVVAGAGAGAGAPNAKLGVGFEAPKMDGLELF